MKSYRVFAALFFTLLLQLQFGVVLCPAQSPPTASAGSSAAAESKTNPAAARKVSAAVLQNYVGRYELGAGIIPVSTLDVTLENGELWVKPSLIKKRRLIAKSRAVFQDEIEGARYAFYKDEEGRVVSLTFRYEGSDYTAQRVMLPAPSLKGNTTFKLKGYADAQVLVLSGSFNNWSESQLIFGREGDEWVCRVDLIPGRYTYKFIVDGNWILDPSNPETEEDSYGNVNSVLNVPAK